MQNLIAAPGVLGGNDATTAGVESLWGERKPRVLIIGPRQQHQGGITRAIESWLAAGLRDSVDVEVLELSAWDARRVAQIVQAASSLTGFIVKLLHPRNRPSLLHLQVSSGASLYRKYVAASLGRWARVPFVVHLHSGGFQDWIDGNRLHRAVARRLIRSAASTVVLAPHWRPLAESLGAGVVHVIPHMYPVSLIDKLQGTRRDSPQRSSAERRLVILSYGRWAPIKGLDLLASAIGGLDQQDQERLELRVFGNGDRNWAEQLFRRCGSANVRIGGWLEDSDKVRELGEADVVVAPSRQEAFGASLLEIMAANAPLITSDAGAIPEVVAGYPLVLITKSGDVADLRDALKLLIEGDWPDAARHELTSSLDRFAPSAVVGKLTAVYRLAIKPC